MSGEPGAGFAGRRPGGTDLSKFPARIPGRTSPSPVMRSGGTPLELGQGMPELPAS